MSAPLELARQQLRDLDRDGAHQHRLPRLVPGLDLRGHGVPLAVLGLVDLVVAVVADHRLVRRDLDDLELVDLHELGGLGDGRPGHARELLVAAEVVLVGDGGDGLALLLDRHPLLGLDGLMQALGPAPPLEDAAGELVDDLDLAVDHGVVDVALVERLGLQRLLQVVDEVAVLRLVEVVDAQEALGLLHAALGHRDRLVLLLGLEVEVRDPFLALGLEAVGLLALLHDPRELGELVVAVGGLLGLAADDERGPGLVDQDVVDLVDDPVAVAALDLLLHLHGQVVAQVVEAELRVGAVDDVAGVGRPLVGVHLAGLDDPHGHAQQVVDRLHPVGVAAGEVVVDRDQVDALAAHRLAVLVPGRERIERDRQRGREGLALTGLHLGDRAVVQHHAADQLDVEVALAERSLARLTGQREALVEELLERLARLVAIAQVLVAPTQVVVGLELELGLKGIDAVDRLFELLELLRLADPQRTVENGHRSYGSKAPAPGRAAPIRWWEPRSRAPIPGACGACPGASSLAATARRPRG